MLEHSRHEIYAQFDDNSHQYYTIYIHQYKYAADYWEKVHMHSVLCHNDVIEIPGARPLVSWLVWADKLGSQSKTQVCVQMQKVSPVHPDIIKVQVHA